MTTTMFSIAMLTLVSMSAAAGCASTPVETTETSSDAIVAPVPPEPPNNALACASVSIPACAQSTLGGACVGAGGAPGTCGSFQAPAQWIPAGPGVATAGYDCNVCAPLQRPAVDGAMPADEALPP